MELSTIISILRRRLALVLIAFITGPNILLGLGLLRQHSAAGLTLLVSRPDGDIADPDRYVGSQIGVLQSDEVAKAVAKAVPNTSADDIRRAISVVQRPRTDVVDIAVNAGGSAQSLAIAKALVPAFLDTRQALRAKDPSAVGSVQGRITQILDELDTLANVPPEDVASPSGVRRTVLLAEYEALIGQKVDADVRAARRDGPVQVLDAPRQITIGGRPSMTSLAAAAIAGGLLGCFAILGVAALGRPRVLSRLQAEEILGGPALAELRHSRQLADRPFFPSGPAASPFERDIAHTSSQIVGQMKGEHFTVLVTSSDSQAGTSTISRALAASFEGTNATVLLVDADLEDADTTTLLGAGGLPGLGRVLADSTTGVEFKYVREVQGRKILFLPADAESAPSGAISYDATGRLVEGSRALADIVVFDGGVASSPAAIALAGHVDVVVVVVPIPGQYADRLRHLLISPPFANRPILTLLNRP